VKETTESGGKSLPAQSDAGPPPKLTAAELKAEQAVTLASPRRRYGPAARVLFALLDLLYGKPRTLSKFKVLEVVARVPYQAWESVAYVAVTHRYSRPTFARRIFDRVNESRHQQDNEQWHLLILEELVEASGKRESFIRYRVVPQALALAYYQLCWVLYALNPRWSYGLNADFEDHAEHEYALLVQENPSFEERPYDGLFAEEYGTSSRSPICSVRSVTTSEFTRTRAFARMDEPRFR
jgi:ubiquinol oxidase